MALSMLPALFYLLLTFSLFLVSFPEFIMPVDVKKITFGKNKERLYVISNGAYKEAVN
jgi:hypothetical protein